MQARLFRAVCLVFIAVLFISQHVFAASSESYFSTYARENGLYESSLSRLGSRFMINPRPQEGALNLSPLGVYFGKPGRMFLAVESGGTRRYLPFSGQTELCEKATQKTGFTSLSFTCADKALPVDVTFSFISPFSPKDEMTSGAPFFYVRVSLRTKKAAEGKVWVAYDAAESLKINAFHSDHGKMNGVSAYGVWTAYHGKETVFDSKRSATMVWAAAAWEKDIRWIGQNAGHEEWLPEGAFGFVWDFAATKPGQTLIRETVLSAYSPKQMMLVQAEYYRFKYVKHFKSAADVAAWAAARMDAIEKKRTAFEAAMKKRFTIPKLGLLPEFTAFAFHSWLMNTWWMTGPKGEEWFSVWEGVCKGHSTLDVAYNEGPMYLELWPELLLMQIDEWPRFRRYPDIMPHDMGFGMNAGGQAMPHDMPVEENTNFILLLGAYWKKTGDTAAVLRHGELLKQLTEYIIRADRSGNGLVDDGTANTIDSGIPATQYSPEQTYLASKTLAAMKFITLMAVPLKDPALAKRAEDMMAKTRETLKKRSWLGDHFAVTIRRTVDFRDPRGNVERNAEGNRVWDGQNDTHTLIDDIDGGNMTGWNAHSIYSANGFYYLFRSGIPAPLDKQLFDMFKKDIAHSAEETLRQYGSTHTDAESVMWVSQNIWMDAVGAYFGVDHRQRLDKYWDFEKHVNQRAADGNSEKGGCFTDTYDYGGETVGLEYYPRGVALFAWPAAWDGFGKAQFDKAVK